MLVIYESSCLITLYHVRGHRGRDRMIVGFTTNYVNQYLSPLILWVHILIRARCTTLCNTVCQWLVTGRWFTPCPLVSSTNKTDRHDITEILLKVTLNTIKQITNKKNPLPCDYLPSLFIPISLSISHFPSIFIKLAFIGKSF